MVVVTKQKNILSDKNIYLISNIRLSRAFVFSVFLSAFETWTLKAELQQRIHVLEIGFYGTIMGILYIELITDDAVRDTAVY